MCQHHHEQDMIAMLRDWLVSPRVDELDLANATLALSLNASLAAARG